MIKSKAATCSLPYFLFRILILFPLSRLVFLKPNLKKKFMGMKRIVLKFFTLLYKKTLYVV